MDILTLVEYDLRIHIKPIPNLNFSLVLPYILGPFLIACAQVPKIDSIKPAVTRSAYERRTLLVGRWYGEQPTKDGLVRKSLMERRRDGTYTVKFQLSKSGVKNQEQVEAGIWGVAGSIYFTATREMLDGENFRAVNTTDPVFYDGYTILNLDENKFHYKAIDDGDEFVVKKVSDKFMLP